MVAPSAPGPDAHAAVARIAEAFLRRPKRPAHRRSAILGRVSELLAGRHEDFARLITAEVAKPIREARREVERAVFTFRWASEEALRFGGEWLPLDLEPAGEGRLAIVRRFPRGPGLFITPFNFPINLCAHKIAPAVAVGMPFLLKPAPQAPRCAAALAEVLREAGLPDDEFAVVACSNEEAEALARDEQFAVLSFTGSAAVGWKLRSIAGKKQVLLELGGNSAVIVAPDADLPWAAARCAWGAYYYSGQSCISVQRIFVHEKVYDAFKDLLLKNVRELKVGDPGEESTDIGPLIDDRSADRVEAWIQEALSKGARRLAGGPRRGRLIEPTLLEGIPAASHLSCDEMFGPVAALEKVASVEEGLDRACDGPYGLQAGLFTRDLSAILRAWERLQVGGLIVNDISAYRSDAMPYGGTRDSGTGREGARYAMEEYTEPRTLVLRA